MQLPYIVKFVVLVCALFSFCHWVFIEWSSRLDYTWRDHGVTHCLLWLLLLLVESSVLGSHRTYVCMYKAAFSTHSHHISHIQGRLWGGCAWFTTDKKRNPTDWYFRNSLPPFPPALDHLPLWLLCHSCSTFRRLEHVKPPGGRARCSHDALKEARPWHMAL